MGVTNSKADKSEALRLCKERKRFIKKAIDSRYNFAASHVAYTQSLRNIGIALRRFAEAEVLIESSLSTSATELDKTPSHSYYPSPAPSHIGGGGVSDPPLPNESPLSPPVARVSYMRAGGSSVVTVSVNPNGNHSRVYDDDGESMTCSMPPPPPPPHHMLRSSWDFFDPVDDDTEGFRFVGHDGYHVNFDDMSVHRHVQENEVYLDGTNGFHEEPVTLNSEQKGHAGKLVALNSSALAAEEVVGSSKPTLGKNMWNGSGSSGTFVGKTASEQSGSKRDNALVEKDVCGEREDPSEFITHRAKDFLSSIKDIEHRFFRASECGKEVSRMLETNKIRVGYFEAKGSSPASAFLTTFHVNCCTGKTALVSNEPANATKVITWNRSTSSRSSSSRNPLAPASKDDNDDSGSDFIEEFCMIAGSHSSTLDRLYAWERKLYDEVKASESIRKVYDQKCDQLRRQFAEDLNAQVIDKTRAVVKDLHSRIIVALHAVDSISKRIEKMRDEELQPQLVELTQGLIRMWKAMLECHHVQYITISLAYHAKSSNGAPFDDSKRQIMTQLQHEIECFGVSYADLVNNHTSYVEALNGWLQLCILQPRERTKGRRAFSPRRVLAPPIFVLCRDWSAGIQGLPSEELSDAIKAFLSDLHHSVEQAAEELLNKQKSEPVENGTVAEEDKEVKNDDRSSNLSSMHTSLAKLLDSLTKFSEAALKMYEDIRQKCETARNAYSNYRPPPRAFSI